MAHRHVLEIEPMVVADFECTLREFETEVLTSTGEPIPVYEVRKIARQITRALIHFTQSGYVHCNVTPNSIVRVPCGFDYVWKLRIDLNTLTKLNTPVVPSTQQRDLAYMAPECFAAEKATATGGVVAVAAQDVWSLGLVILELLSRGKQQTPQWQGVRCFYPTPLPTTTATAATAERKGEQDSETPASSGFPQIAAAAAAAVVYAHAGTPGFQALDFQRLNGFIRYACAASGSGLVNSVSLDPRQRSTLAALADDVFVKNAYSNETDIPFLMTPPARVVYGPQPWIETWSEQRNGRCDVCQTSVEALQTEQPDTPLLALLAGLSEEHLTITGVDILNCKTQRRKFSSFLEHRQRLLSSKLLYKPPPEKKTKTETSRVSAEFKRVLVPYSCTVNTSSLEEACSYFSQQTEEEQKEETSHSRSGGLTLGFLSIRGEQTNEDDILDEPSYLSNSVYGRGLYCTREPERAIDNWEATVSGNIGGGRSHRACGTGLHKGEHVLLVGWLATGNTVALTNQEHSCQQEPQTLGRRTDTHLVLLPSSSKGSCSDSEDLEQEPLGLTTDAEFNTHHGKLLLLKTKTQFLPAFKVYYYVPDLSQD
jgi:serine/threonine protein kinase